MTAKSVSISGLIKSTLCEGWTQQDVLSEGIDNARKAGANHIRHFIDTTSHPPVLRVVDNGQGMDEPTLADSHMFHNRKEASEEGQGKFGMGMKFWLIYYTQHEAATMCFTKQAGQTLLSLKADWLAAVETDTLILQPQEASRRQEEIWDAVTESANHGTLFTIPLSHKKCDELVAAVKASYGPHHLLHNLGKMYYEDLQQGFRITFTIDGVEYEVKPVDILCLDGTKKLKQTVELTVVKHQTSSEIRTYYKTGRKYGYLKCSSDKYVKSNIELVEEQIPEDFVRIGKATVQSSYNEGWDKIQPTLFDDWTLHIREKLIAMGGRYWQRSKKVIHRTPLPEPTSGDFAKKRFVTDSRHILKFGVELDDLMDVQINKSKITESNVHPSIANAYMYIVDSWIDTIYKKYKKDSEQASDLQGTVTAAVTTGAAQNDNTPKKAIRVVKAAPAATILDAVREARREDDNRIAAAVQNPPPQEPEPEEQAQEPVPQQHTQGPVQQETAAQETAPPTSEPAQATSNVIVAAAPAKIQVKPFEREQSKSPQDIVQMMLKLYNKYSVATLEEKLGQASQNAQPGLVNLYRSLTEVDAVLMGIE